MNPGSISAWTRVGGRVTAPATAATMDVIYYLYQSSGWVNIDDVEVTAVAPPANYVTKYYYFNGQRVAMRVNGVLNYLHADHLGSTVLETNNSGAIINDEKYRAFGKQRDTGIVGTDYQFTGQKQDASGLVYMNARFFDPQTGMFVSPDTIVPDAGLVSDYNRLAYARGNALKYNDPTGHIVTGDCMCGGGSTFAEAQAYAYENAARTATNVGVSAVMATIAVANALDTNEGEKVTPTAPPVLGPQPKPATQTGTQTWLPLSDGMDISIPGTNATEGNGWIDPGFTQGMQSPGDNVYTSALSDNMAKAGIARPPGAAAHHIVAQNDRRASVARGILSAAGIGVNDAINGVYLPKNLQYPTVGGATHSTIHTDRHYQEVTDRLLNRGRKTVQTVLQEINQELQKGTFPH